jgi:DNA-binding MarR family transcriptional regulator
LATENCAREILETVPLVMRFIRCHVRQHPATGLILPQFRALSYVSRVNAPSLSEVAEHLGVGLPAMSRLADDLVRKGWMDRRPVANNRRQIALDLTAAGSKKLESVRAAIRRRLAEKLTSLSAAERSAVREAMQALRGAFEVKTSEGGRVPKRRL